jgi:hypothetical protein
MNYFFNNFFQKKSKLFKVSIINTFGFKKDIFLKTRTEVYIDIIPNSIKKFKRIIVILEPDEISGIRNSLLSLKPSDFDLILTHDPIVLNHFTNSKLFPFGTTWIKDFDFCDKVYGVSTLIGGKSITVLHRLRHRLLELLDLNFDINLFFFNSYNQALENSNNNLPKIKSSSFKNELFFCQFHIAIENVISDNWFTEKLIDCFQTKTVPIYLGCPNIGNYFDKRGMIIVESFSDIISVLESLKPDTYFNMLEFINKNYELSKEYIDFGIRLEKELYLIDK